jgi:hypothetical protein
MEIFNRYIENSNNEERQGIVIVPNPKGDVFSPLYSERDILISSNFLKDGINP